VRRNRIDFLDNNTIAKLNTTLIYDAPRQTSTRNNKRPYIGIPSIPGKLFIHPSASSLTLFCTTHLFPAAGCCVFKLPQLAPMQPFASSIAFCKLSFCHPNT
jgi:hypothetical protein